MHRTFIILIFPLLLSVALTARGQTPFRVMSYNVENLFDTSDNEETDDDEFLPSSLRRWTFSRYNHKLKQIARIICAAGEWDTPALVGLCEAENDTVLSRLLRSTPLRQQPYRYLITQGSDKRGINVALLYRRDQFRYIDHRSIQVKFKSAAIRPTRDILHAWGEILSGDTLDVIVCHFPSKYGGEKESEAQRLDAAGILVALSDSLSLIRRHPLQIIMGDFNDEPDSRCMRRVAGDSLLNLFAPGNPASGRGSQKYQGEWSQLDQIIIRRRMAESDSPVQFVPGSARTFSPSFLLIDDKTWRGKRPRRTYHGFKYEGGYSDHLPVITDFLIK
jgi:endonuclease/exonuclease/phosphatase family metal-dependent hydrolase